MLLKILSLNSWLLPKPFSIKNDLRIEMLSDLVKKLDPDMIFLQEIWMNSQITYITKLFKNHRPYFLGGKYYNKTGLCCFSKNDFKDVSYKVFSDTNKFNLYENLAKKGYQRIETEKLVFYNVHMFCPVFGWEKAIVRKQFDEIRKEVVREKKPCFITGDLNITEKELNEINGDLFTEYVLENTLRTDNPYTKVFLNKFGMKDEIADHILIFGFLKNMALNVKVLDKPHISDHNAIVSEIEIK